MYPFDVFKVQDQAEIRDFLDEQVFATLIAQDASGGFVATHLPLLIAEWGERIVLRGHVMRASDHGRALREGSRVFAAFLGPHAPILGSWQQTPRFGGTWNYQAVHVHGQVQLRDGETLLDNLKTLKHRFETSPQHQFDSLPQDYIDAMLPAIQCIDLCVTDIQAVFKLSQNRSLAEFDRTAAELALRGGQAALVAEVMRSRRDRYFGG